jgi:hypothetical protein
VWPENRRAGTPYESFVKGLPKPNEEEAAAKNKAA